ncbi:MAG: proton-conducting transporter membrane subunit, partial [Bacteroidota bacterium]
MILFLLGLGLLVVSAPLAFLHRSIAAWGGMLGASLALLPSLSALLGHSLELSLPWSVPLGSFSLGLDPLSAFFLLPTLALSVLAAFYGTGYLKTEVKGPWCFFNLLVATMALVLTARNGMLFLMAWVGMAIASFLLVTTEHERPEVQRAGWIYLVATHLGTAVLLLFFTILAQCAGSLDFSKIELLRTLPANELFLLALVGFGMKAGFLHLHVWLPEAHPAAPSHVSALMSGVMIKTGIYGLVRTLTWLGAPPAWWGYLLIGIGLSSGILGVLFALAQHDLKRLLAYHSVENIGIITLGLGLGTLGVALHSVPMAVLGFGGGLFHVLNHALFKGLLFLGAGSVLHGSGTLELDRLGGLLKSMPWTGYTFLVGAVAISGLPPLNGFASELLIYAGAFHGLFTPSQALLPLAGLVGLALIGGLATACFTKAFGIVCLGEPRQALPPVHENRRMSLSMGILALACFLASFLALPIFKLLLPAIAPITGMKLSILAGTFPA